MIKGVTKSMIEIIPGNSNYEKIIVILRSNSDIPDKSELTKQIKLLTNSTPDFLKRQKRSAILKMMVSATVGSLLTAASFLIIYTFV